MVGVSALHDQSADPTQVFFINLPETVAASICVATLGNRQCCIY